MELKARLTEIDNWLSRLKPRWMDLVGDYAGDEFFVVDGDSICQLVLDDDLLVVGKQDKPGFQILHALHNFEQTILALKNRDCNFEVVFFDCNKHGTVWASGGDFVASSRLLARQILKSHAGQLSQVASVEFDGLEDTRWHDYVKAKQPMFIFCHSGPDIGSANDMELHRILLQRTFIRDVLMSRIAVSLLNETKYVDAKVLSFVYERQRLGDTKSGLPKDWNTSHAISERLCQERYSQLVSNQNQISPSVDRVSWLLQGATIFASSPSEPIDRALSFVFLASQLILPHISIEQRAQIPYPVDSKLKVYLISEFYPKLFGALASSLHNSTFLPDLDGNLFLVTLNTIIASASSTIDTLIGDAISEELTTAWASIGLPFPDLSVLSARFQSANPIIPPPSMESPYELLRFSHPVLDPYLESVAVHTASSAASDLDTRTRLDRLCDEPFIDEKHWHNTKSILPKHLGGKDDGASPNLTSWERMKQLRRDQRFMTNLQRHAQTLTGAKGNPIQRIVISEVGKSSAPSHHPRSDYSAPSSKPPHSTTKPGKGSKSKGPQLSSADKLKAKIEAEKKTKKASEDEIWWKAQLKELEGTQNPDERILRVENILRGKRAEKGWLSVEVPLFQIHLILTAWIEDERGEEQGICEQYAVRVLHSIHTLRDNQDLFPVAAQTLALVLSVLGFDKFVPPSAKTQDDRELSFKFVKLIKSKSGRKLHPHLSVKGSPTEFQLKAYGVYMDRSMDSAPDPRVTFEPDGWQRQVLDKIDRKESTLVVAPTSAGKTFSSFYAMEKVLREDNDGIIVYVSPTKALCQQIAADVYARFSKNLKGKTVWAIHTRDFRVHDPLKTQILVTVPEILSIMLLSPSIANVWTPRLKWIILDEIHSIGQLEGGQVWEHILLLSTCPILGLSATVGQPEVFSEWLGSVQAAHNQRYSLVEHKHRYSHLRKHIWQMPSHNLGGARIFRGLDSPAPSDKHLVVLHPMSALLLGGRTIPPDLALEAQDCLSLYRMLKNCVSANQLSHLEPKVYFEDRTTDFLKQADVIQYEGALKEVVGTWMKSSEADHSDSPYQKLLVELQKDYHQGRKVDMLQDAHSPKVAIENLIDLMHKLNAQGDLPCLAFNFDRAGCEKYAKALLATLIKSEREWRETDPRWIEKLKQWEAWKANSKARERDAQRASRQKKDDAREEEPTSWQSLFDPNEPAPEFSFANTKSGYSKDELRKDIHSLKWQKTPEYLISALKRGIAVHHAGMPKGYRSLVESLFRLGYCRVVISTGTLALDRIHRLMLSRIPPLTGNWPLTTTLCLRLFNLLTGSGHAPAAVSAIDSFMRLPRLSVSSDQSRQEVLHHMRFSIDFLQRSRLLSSTGHTTALFGIVGHLYYEEPGNLAFAALVRAGVLHRMCSTFKTNQTETEKNIICLVATLLARRPLPHFAASEIILDQRRKTSPSIIKLPALPNYVLKVLQDHNRETLRVFTAYATTFSAQHLQKQPDNVLPLSKQEIGPSAKPFDGKLATILQETRVKGRVACSSFVSNSGHGDTFSSVTDLCRSARSGLHLNGHSIPYFDYSLPVNAYAFDYWQHESVRPLSEANGIRDGEVWFALQNFFLALATLTASLRVLLIDRVATEEVQEIEDIDDEGDIGLDVEKPDIEQDELLGQTALVDRPLGVPEEDWLVYEAFQSVTNTFYQKWEKMWA
ncbi:hypothetical protein FS749_011922 [Ceratobasidium sp. UAMH 11750]|nr:hypothetical protein FS749_011922 [Ceratobasidium sp. UAMH 11750]